MKFSISKLKYQIIKINPSSFKKLFSNIELGAGASIYCKNTEELWKNAVCGEPQVAYIQNDTSEMVYEVLYSENTWDEIASPLQKSARFNELNSESNEDGK